MIQNQVLKGTEMNELTKNDLKQAKKIASEKVEAIKSDLERKLFKWFKSSVRMEHGQIKCAASYTVKNLGHEWILFGDDEDKYVRMYVKLEVKTLVKSIVGQWHENPSRVWLQFRDYCLEMAAAAAAKDAIKKFTIKSA